MAKTKTKRCPTGICKASLSGADDTAINIAADYVAKHGAPSAAAPKIFFRYYFVNSSTGEKSGTILAECKWTAAAAAGGEP